jgi:RNA-directed DNA polymerase
MEPGQMLLDFGDQAGRRKDTLREETIATRLSKSSTGEVRLMESICERENMRSALRRVQRNGGAPGIDKMKVSRLRGFLRRTGETVKATLLDGTYKPLPVRRKEIPKPDGGGVRLLGIPTCLDRFVQQCIAQVLLAIWEHTFSESSYGYRLGRSQAQAVEQYRKHVEEGYTYVVSLDLSKFFDRVNHDRLLSRLAQRIEDKRVLKIIRAFLNSGIMLNDLVEYPGEGTPQGGPLSPLLSNIVLDELDKELERRGLRFVRYADDIRILARSQREGEEVLGSIREFITGKLKLKVNEQKSCVLRPWNAKFLGFRVTRIYGVTRTVIHPKTVRNFKDRVREITRRVRGSNIHSVIEAFNSFLRGWRPYYEFSMGQKLIHELNSWIVRRLKAFLWNQWRLPRTKVKRLEQRGIAHDDAMSLGNTRKGAWRISRTPTMNFALPQSLFVRQKGLLLLG